MKTKFLTLFTLILTTTSAICSDERRDTLDLPNKPTTTHTSNRMDDTKEDLKPLFSSEFLNLSGSDKVLMNYRRLSKTTDIPTDKDIKTPLSKEATHLSDD
jgi:hypothetical protein